MGHGVDGENSLPTTFFKINGLKEGSTEIFFEGKVKEGNEYVLIDTKPTKLYGHLTEVSVKEFEWKDETHKLVRLVIDDADERVVLEGGFSNVMVGLVNTLAGNKEAIDKIELGVYISKKGYPSMSISIDGGTWEDNKWKFDYNKKIKPLIEVTKDKKGKIVATDKTALIDFLVKEIESKDFQGKIQGTPPEKAEAQVAAEMPDFPDSSVEGDDLPH